MNDKTYFNEKYNGIFDEVALRLKVTGLFPQTSMELIAENILTELEGNLDLTDKELILQQVDKYVEAVVHFKS